MQHIMTGVMLCMLDVLLSVMGVCWSAYGYGGCGEILVGLMRMAVAGVVRFWWV